MGRINFPASSLFGGLSDLVGTKSGLALTKQRIIQIFEQDGSYAEYGNLPDDAWVRIESVDYEDMVELLLYAVGRLERRGNNLPMAAVLQKFGRTPEVIAVASDIGELFFESLQALRFENRPGEKLDPTHFMTAAAAKHGRQGLDMAVEFISAFNVQIELRSYEPPQTRSWRDIIELDDLFKSEGLAAQQGAFIDQRFIDYINRNFDGAIDEMHWRKFEALTAEYFARQGYQVDLGPGRNDDGVDVRVWPADGRTDQPPAIIVQCKRQRADIPKVVVKALYTDVVHHEATSGLIVTTSRLSPGAKAVCEARRYPIREAERETVRTWVGEMRKPGLGTTD